MNFQLLFNSLGLIITRLQNNSTIEKKDNKEHLEIFLTTEQIANIGYEHEDFGMFLDFLYCKNISGDRIFDIECLYSKDKIEEGNYEEFINCKYKITFEKESTIFLWNFFENLKDIFFEEKKQNEFLEYFNKCLENNELPIRKNFENEYYFDKTLFKENNEELKELCLDLFNNTKRSDKKIEDNSDKYYNVKNFELDFKKTIELKEGNKSKQDRKNGGTTRAKNKKFDDEITYKNLEKSLYFIYLKLDFNIKLHGDKLNLENVVQRKSDLIYDILEFLTEIKRMDKRMKDYSFYLKQKIEKFQIKKISEAILNEIKEAEGKVYTKSRQIISKYLKINKETIDDFADYIGSEKIESQRKQFYKWCSKFDKIINKS